MSEINIFKHPQDYIYFRMASILRTGRFSDANEHNRNLTPVFGYLSSPLLPLETALERITRLIISLDRYIIVSKRQCHYPSKHGLTRDESAAVYLYSMDWGEQSLYRVLNQALRDENRQTIIPWFAYLKLLDTALEKLPTFTGNIWRGVCGNTSRNFAEGQALTWWSVTSCSPSVDVVKSFLTANSTLFLIEASNGKQISGYSAYPNENEVILRPGTRLNAAGGVLDHAGGLHVVHLKELIDDSSLLNSEPTRLHSQSLSVSSMVSLLFRLKSGSHFEVASLMLLLHFSLFYSFLHRTSKYFTSPPPKLTAARPVLL